MERDGGAGSKIQVEIEDGKRVRLSIPGVETQFLDVPRKAPKYISDTELTALTVMKLAIPLTFPEETTGVDQAGYQVRREEDIYNLPGGRESDYRDALSWAGAILQARRWESLKVASIIMDELPEQVRVGRSFGDISPETWNVKMNSLRRTIAGSYPGAAAAIRRRRKRKIPQDW